MLVDTATAPMIVIWPEAVLDSDCSIVDVNTGLYFVVENVDDPVNMLVYISMIKTNNYNRAVHFYTGVPLPYMYCHCYNGMYVKNRKTNNGLCPSPWITQWMAYI